MIEEEKFKIGIISEFDETTQNGKIQTYGGDTIEFEQKHISDGIILHKGDIVGFFREDWDEIVSLNLADNMTIQFENEGGNFCGYEWAMVKQGNKDFFLKDIVNIINPLVTFYNNIEKHVEKTEIEKLVSNYSVGIRSFGINKIGGDDSFYVYLTGGVSMKEYELDTYINSILPKIDIRKHSSSAYCSWSKMEYSFYKDEKNVEKLKEEAKTIEIKNKEIALKSYSKHKHLNELRFTYLSKIQIILSKYFNENENLIKKDGILINHIEK